MTKARTLAIHNYNPDPDPAVRRQVMELKAWAGNRRCLPCAEGGHLHVPHKITTDRGTRLALLRGEGAEQHEFDPGERRRR